MITVQMKEADGSDQSVSGKDLIDKVIMPEVIAFEKVFQKLAGSPLTGMEKEVLKVYLYQKLSNQP